ncbi:hypothetical protein QBC39DRAFT_305884 [Podospora conica]|nr:hypothetical protein QBC39DRAFT_305884 [Schizothecium conicum]
MASQLAHLLLLLPLATALPQKFNIKPMVPNSIRLDSTFTLVVNVTDPALDFPTFPVHGLSLGTVRFGNQQSIATVTNTTGAQFFLTSLDATRGNADLAAWPLGLTLHPGAQPESGEFPRTQSLGVDAGYGTPGLSLPTKAPVDFSECPVLAAPEPGTYVVCDAGFDAPQHPRWMVRWVAGTAADVVPAKCVAVRLMPQCVRDGEVSKVAPLKEGETPVQALCWDDIKTVDWKVSRAKC